MQEDRAFESKGELEDWLRTQGVDDEKASGAAGLLFSGGFNRPSTLLDISSEFLREAGLSLPVAQHLRNKLKVQQQQQQKDEDNVLGPGVYEKLTSAVCFFRDGGSAAIGAGFAVSETTVCSAAHNFPEAAEDTETLCYFGKPNQRIVRRLRFARIDRRLDYCILKTIQGEALLPEFLEVSNATSTVEIKPGKNCVLAAFQIGIQEDLKDLDPDLSVGVFTGVISKLYPRHFVYQCASFAGDSGGAVVLKDGKVIGMHQETVIQARDRLQHATLEGDDDGSDARLESVEASVDELLASLSSGSIGLQLSAIPLQE